MDNRDYNIKKKMIARKAVFGTWCMLPSSFVVDVVARSGLDFVVIDMEHGTMSFETAEEMVRAAQLQGCHPLIRVGDDGENTILHALETGCEAVLVPHVSTVEAAERVVSAARYAPGGARGLSPYTRCHGYTHRDLADSMERNNDRTLTGILVEGREGLANLPAIAKVDGLDLVYLGLYDISQSIGLSGMLEHPEVQKQVKVCLESIHEGGKFAGIFSRDLASCRSFKEAGFNFIAYVADSYGLLEYFSDACRQFKEGARE